MRFKQKIDACQHEKDLVSFDKSYVTMFIACFTLNWQGTYAFNMGLELCWQFLNITEYHPLERYYKTVDQIILKYYICEFILRS